MITTIGWFGVVAAAPAIEVVSCPFSSAQLQDAIALELAGLGKPDVELPAITVTCTDGSARLGLASTTGDAPIAREVDLGDVPADLAPRVVAVVLAASVVERSVPRALEPAPAIEPTPAIEAAPTPSTSAPTTTPATTTPAPTAAPGFAPTARDRGAPLTRWRAAVLGPRRWRLGVGARALVRQYRGSPTLLWGAGVEAVLGPFSLGLVYARSSVDDPLGVVTAAITALDTAATLACTTGDTTTCLGVRIEIGRGTIAGAPTAPTITAAEVSSLAARGTAELSFARAVAGLELAARIDAGASAGAVGRVSGVEVARLGGWTVGASVEVRR